MNQSLQAYEKKQETLQTLAAFSEDKKNLIKRTYCKDCTDDEFMLFVNVCQHTGLDPTLKQVYAIKRKTKDGNGSMTIQTSIDGLRLIADRTGKYCPGREPIFSYDKQGKLFSATSFVKKRTRDGIWHEVSATAVVSEYKPKYANDFWDTKTHLMTAKCAEALALRKAFPAEMSGLYSDDEMHQAEVTVSNSPSVHSNTYHSTNEIEMQSRKNKEKLNADAVKELEMLLNKCSEIYRADVEKFLKTQGIESKEDMPQELYEKVVRRTLKELNINISESKKEEEQIEEAV